jgi:hypothetical protein|tara:strand:- start:2448 stop:2579 length:132 start_codon:yes stop_codon:yes gene_type:complete
MPNTRMSDGAMSDGATTKNATTNVGVALDEYDEEFLSGKKCLC